MLTRWMKIVALLACFGLGMSVSSHCAFAFGGGSGDANASDPGTSTDDTVDPSADGSDPNVVNVASTGKLPKNWVAQSPSDPSFRNGCDQCASDIQGYIGGNIVYITPKPPAPTLGGFNGANPGWDHHIVVVKGGRVYDAFTGSAGLPVADYKRLWQYPDAINFPF